MSNFLIIITNRPCLNQSKKSYLDLLIREFYKGKKKDLKEIHSIDNAIKNPKLISGWIKDVEEIQKNKQAPTIYYSKKMPNLDDLLQQWDPEFENELNNLVLPSENLDMPTETLCKIACNILDIPIHNTKDNKNLIESTHLFFSLYLAFKNNIHFQQNQVENLKLE